MFRVICFPKYIPLSDLKQYKSNLNKLNRTRHQQRYWYRLSSGAGVRSLDVWSDFGCLE